MPLTAAETKRKLLHMAVGGFAFLLRFLTWPQAVAAALLAILFNWQVLPRIGGRTMWRDHEHRAGSALGMPAYPVSVLALVLASRDDPWKAAAVWALLAFGDGMAIATGRADRDPNADLRGALAPVVERNHPAITEPKAVGELLRAIDGYSGQAATQCALKLAPLVFVRPSELRAARWEEFDLDRPEPEWQSPPAG